MKLSWTIVMWGWAALAAAAEPASLPATAPAVDPWAQAVPVETLLAKLPPEAGPGAPEEAMTKEERQQAAAALGQVLRGQVVSLTVPAQAVQVTAHRGVYSAMPVGSARAAVLWNKVPCSLRGYLGRDGQGMLVDAKTAELLKQVPAGTPVVVLGRALGGELRARGAGLATPQPQTWEIEVILPEILALKVGNRVFPALPAPTTQPQ